MTTNIVQPSNLAHGSFTISLWPTARGGRVNAIAYDEDGWGFSTSVVVKSGLLPENWDGESSLKLELDHEGFFPWKKFLTSYGGVPGSNMYLRPCDEIPPGSWYMRDIAGGWMEGYDRQAMGIRGLEQQGHIPQPEQKERKNRNVRVQQGKSFWLPKTCCFLYHGELSKSEHKVLEYIQRMSSGGTGKSGGWFYGSAPNTGILLDLSERIVRDCFHRLAELGFLKVPADADDRESEFGTFNYIVMNHEEYVKERGGDFCLRGRFGAKARAIAAGMRVGERDE